MKIGCERESKKRKINNFMRRFFNSKTVVFSALIIIFAIIAPFSFGQTQKLKTWSPPDNSFSVEVPVKLKEYKDTYESTKSFAAIKSAYIIVIHIFEGENTKETSKEKLGGAEFTIGGDDDNDFVERYFKIDGLTAREVFYAKQNVRGIMIDAGNRVYILGIKAKNREDLDSDMARRFFSSFRLLKIFQNKN